MGRQVPFFAVGRDHDDLLAMFEAEGLLAFPRDLPTGIDVPRVPPRTLGVASGSTFCLVHADTGDESLVLSPHRMDPSHSRLDESRSPVIEVRLSKQVGDEVHDGRIYLAQPRGFPDHEAIARSYDRLARRVKKWPRTDLGALRVGPETAGRVASGELRLVSFGTEVHPMA